MLMGHGCGVRMSTVTIPTTHSARAHMMHVLVVDALHGIAPYGIQCACTPQLAFSMESSILPSIERWHY